MSKTATAPVICEICKKAESPHGGMVAELIRPSLLEFIKKATPGLDSNGFICFDDLGEFRKNYVKEVLQDEIGELSVLDQEVIRKETHLRRAPLRPDCRVRRELEVPHYIWRCYLRVDRCERRVARYQSVRSLSVHPSQFDSLLSRRCPGTGHHDEPKPRRGARPFARGERLQSQFESRA